LSHLSTIAVASPNSQLAAQLTGLAEREAQSLVAATHDNDRAVLAATREKLELINDSSAWEYLRTHLPKGRYHHAYEVYEREQRVWLLQKWATMRFPMDQVFSRFWLSLLWSEVETFLQLGLPNEWNTIALIMLMETPLQEVSDGLPPQSVVNLVAQYAPQF